MTDFQVQALDASFVRRAKMHFDEGAPDVRLVEVDKPTGFPCRVTLQWTQPGERILLFRHRPFEGPSPYAEEGPVFARLDAIEADLPANTLPAYLSDIALVSVRGYDNAISIIHAEAVPGSDCGTAIRRAFENADVEFLQVRSATHGCFQFRVDRA